jgi:hypothetical protein
MTVAVLNPLLKKLTLGVSICLDAKKGQSRRLRKSRQFQKVSLDDRDISIEIEKSQFCLDTSEKSEKSEKSQSRPRNLSRHDIFGKSRQFVSISIES